MICKKIGVDFHGVININPDFFKEFNDFALSQGHEIHIISGGPRDTIEKFLALHKIKYTVLWCIFDYFDAKNEVEFLPDGSFHVDDVAWDSAKGEYCRRNGICVHVDDSRIYGKYFTTPYCLYDEYGRYGILNGATIDFSDSAGACLKQIMLICDN